MLYVYIISTYLQVTHPVLTRLTRFDSGNAEGETSVFSSMFSLLAREEDIVGQM